MYMISCNDLTLSSCSISCPISVGWTCLWYWQSVLNWILYYYDINFFCFFFGWPMVSWVAFWSEQTMNIWNPCFVSGGVVYKSYIWQLSSRLCYFYWTHTLVAVSSLLWFTFCMFTKPLPDRYDCAGMTITVHTLTLYANISEDFFMHLLTNVDFRCLTVFCSNALQHNENCKFSTCTFHLS